MFLAILHNDSGEEYIRRLGPNESISLEEHVIAWVDSNSGGELKPSFSKPGSLIPSGCGEYTAEIRGTKKPSASCWVSLDFYEVAA